MTIYVSWLSHTHTNTTYSFRSHRLIFSHASAEVSGENTPERKVASTGDRTHNYQSCVWHAHHWVTRAGLIKKGKQEGQDGPGSITWIFERIIAIFFFFVAFKEEFTRISLCPYIASSPHSLMPCLLTDQNFVKICWKGSPKKLFYEVISKSDQWFQRKKTILRICLFQYSESSPHSVEPYLMMDQNFANSFWKKKKKKKKRKKKSLKVHFCEIISKSDQWFLRRILKEFLMKFHLVPMVTRVFLESNSVNYYWREPHKEHSS